MLGPFGKKSHLTFFSFLPHLMVFPNSKNLPEKQHMPPSYHKPLSNDVSLWTREHANNNPQLSIFAVVFTPSKSMPSCTSKVQCIQWGHSVPDRKPTSWQHHFESSCESEPLTAIVFDMFFHLRQNPETETDSAHLFLKEYVSPHWEFLDQNNQGQLGIIHLSWGWSDSLPKEYENSELQNVAKQISCGASEWNMCA